MQDIGNEIVTAVVGCVVSAVVSWFTRGKVEKRRAKKRQAQIVPPAPKPEADSEAKPPLVHPDN